MLDQLCDFRGQKACGLDPRTVRHSRSRSDAIDDLTFVRPCLCRGVRAFGVVGNYVIGVAFPVEVSARYLPLGLLASFFLVKTFEEHVCVFVCPFPHNMFMHS